MKTKHALCLIPLLAGALFGLFLITSFAQGPLPNPNRITLTQGTKAVTAAGTPVKLVATIKLVDSVEILARKNDTTANTGVILLGFSPTAGNNHRVIAIGTTVTLTALANKKIDLSSIYIDAATNGDAVVWTALQ